MRIDFGIRIVLFCLMFRDAVRAKLISSGVVGEDAYVVIGGPANTYAHYVATKEEYTVQRYEGASTIFGKCAFPLKLPPFSSSSES